MNDATFDNLTRLLGSRPSRRQVLKGIAGGGTLAVPGMTRAVENAAAQCLDDGTTCAAGTECCSGACSASLGVCVTMDECVADGDPCTDGSECCGGACSASLGVCVTMDECVADGQACSVATDCCSGNCDASSGTCFTPAATTLPATGSGRDGETTASMLLPAAALGAAAVIGARRLRGPAQESSSD